MAQVKKIEWDAIPLEKRVTIGHNRTIYKPQADLLYCSLHDNTVAIFRKAADGGFDVTLDHCGWMTTTTMRAIGDFLKFAGISAGVSRAGGTFRAFVSLSRDKTARIEADKSGRRIYFNAPHIDPWSHVVVICGVYPMVATIKAKSEYTANMAADHLRAMFPHVRDFVSVVQADSLRADMYHSAFNAIRDCSAAYCSTGNGANPRPIKGSVALWEGSSPCGKVS